MAVTDTIKVKAKDEHDRTANYEIKYTTHTEPNNPLKPPDKDEAVLD